MEAKSPSLTVPLTCFYTIVIMIDILDIGEVTLLTPLLDFHFDLISLKLEKLMYDSIAMPEQLAPSCFGLGMPGDMPFP